MPQLHASILIKEKTFNYDTVILFFYFISIFQVLLFVFLNISNSLFFSPPFSRMIPVFHNQFIPHPFAFSHLTCSSPVHFLNFHSSHLKSHPSHLSSLPLSAPPPSNHSPQLNSSNQTLFLFHPLTHLPTHPSTNPPTNPSTNPPTNPSTNPPIYQPTHLPIHQPTHLPTNSPTFPLTHPPTH